MLFALSTWHKTPKLVLNWLTYVEDSDVRYWVAINPNASPETLARLADDESSYVRSRVAFNPNTLPETLERLVNDKSYLVRCTVAENLNTPQYIKDYLKIKKFLNYYGQY